jgi:hypothetical protein
VSTDVARDGVRQGRRWLLLAVLAAALLVPGTPLVQSLAPIDATGLLIVPALAICAVVAWALGGRGWLAAVWVTLAVVVLIWTNPTGGSYAALERGWVLALVAFFGLVCVASAAATRFFTRAMTALAATTTLAVLLLAGTPGATRAVTKALSAEMAGRRNAALEWVRGMTATSPDRLVRPTPLPATGSAESMERTLEDVLASLPQDSLPLAPALLALESLAALALAWELFHYISRTRIGEPLRPVRDFRFSDQLVWGLIVGVTLIVAPTPDPWRMIGLNLALFFGALYAVRGLGVLVWFLETRRASASAVVALAVTASLLSAPAAVGLGLLGLGDSWLDWRGTEPTPTTHPVR